MNSIQVFFNYSAKILRDFILIFSVFGIVYLVIQFYYNYQQIKIERLFKSNYTLFQAVVTESFETNGKFIAFRKGNSDSIIKYYPNSIGFIKSKELKLIKKDTIVVAHFENGKYQIIIYKDWIEKFNIPIWPWQEKHIPKD